MRRDVAIAAAEAGLKCLLMGHVVERVPENAQSKNAVVTGRF